MKKNILIFFILASTLTVKAQQYALYHTKTMFDAFENPAQKAYTLDSSRQFASNFFIPNFGFSAINKGPAEYTFRKLINEGKNDTRLVELNTGEINTFGENLNIYLFTYRIFKSGIYEKELGFSWQIRSEALFDFTNETLAILDSYKRFEQKPYDNVFNNKGFQQTYHQFSVSYRENLSKQIAFGAKASILSGIVYNSLNIDRSYLYVDPPNNQLDVRLKGVYKGTFVKTNELDKNTILPFKNPGLSLSLGTSYTSKTGFFFMGNLKDLGFIYWGKKSHVARFDVNQNIDNIQSGKEIQRGFTDIAVDNEEQKAFISPTNAKVDFLISKTFGFYKPSFILAKNLFNKGGDFAMVNTFNLGEFALSAVPAYNFNQVFMVGAQAKYQTPNFELYLGTDNLMKTYDVYKGINEKSADIGSGYNGASAYFGISFKFGYIVERPENLSYTPINKKHNAKSFFRKVFKVFENKGVEESYL